MEDSNKKYKPMENVLHHINAKVIALQENEKKRNTKILDHVTRVILDWMKQKDPLFKGMFEKIFYGGSYFDNLKVGNPDEYDLDLILNLPVSIEPRVEVSDKPGFVHVGIGNYNQISKRPEHERKLFEKLDSLLDKGNCYLSTTNFLQWMESLFNFALKKMPKDGTETYVDVPLDKTKDGTKTSVDAPLNKPDELLRIYIIIIKGPPAFQIKLSSKNIHLKLDIDLVPCFQFTKEEHWPKAPYRPNTSTSKKSFLVVPKKPKDLIMNEIMVERYWRLSFQEQERELISQDLKALKPSLRLLKKLRDRHNHAIASYFIKTIFIWTVEEEKDVVKKKAFWSQALSIVFMSMLKKYAELLRTGRIPYYWNREFNLIDSLNPSTITQIANKLYRIIKDVEVNLTADPRTIGGYLLKSEQFEQLKKDIGGGKKLVGIICTATTSSAPNGSPPVDSPDSSKSNTSPPLINALNFDKTDVDALLHYSNSIEVKQILDSENLKAQMNNISNKFLNNNDLLTYLQKIDGKMDTMLERFDKSENNNKEINSKLATLEEQVTQLQLENAALRKVIKETENRAKDKD